MAFVPHYRVTMLGRLGGTNGSEIWSAGFTLISAGSTTDEVPNGLGPNDAVWDDIADDCADYFSRQTTRLHQDAWLKMVKISRIGADGKYTHAPVEKVREVSGNTDLGVRFPNQCAAVVTLHTAGDLNRVKGRFYLPLPATNLESDGRLPAAIADGMEASSVTFVDAINNQPGIDVLGLVVGVASQGRHNSDGSVRQPPRNYVVDGVSVGRVIDTMRTRRNKLAEARSVTPL